MKNLSRKKKDAWLRFRDIFSSDGDQHSTALAGFCRFRRLSKVTSEKVRNAWSSARAVEAEQKAKISQQLGHSGSSLVPSPYFNSNFRPNESQKESRDWVRGYSGSIIKELRLLKNQVCKPSSSLTTSPRTIVLRPFSPMRPTSFSIGQNTLLMCLIAVLWSVSVTLKNCQTSLQPHHRTDQFPDDEDLFQSIIELMAYQLSC